MMAESKQIKSWAAALTPEQLLQLVEELTQECIYSEVVRFWGTCKAPYWEATGEPLVEGQKCFEEEE